MPFRKAAPPSPDTAVPSERRWTPRATVPNLARDAIEDLMGLVSSQIELTRVEIASDMRATTRAAVRLLILIPLFTVGYCLLLAAGVFWLASLTNWYLALLLLGGVHVAAALMGFRRVARLLSQVHFLDRTGAQLGASVAQLTEDARPALKPPA